MKLSKVPLALALLGGACDHQTTEVSHAATGAEMFALTAEWPAFAQVQGQGAQIDVLFMVDNSPSMGAAQAKLAAGFRDFMTTIEKLPGGVPDLHIGVVSSNMGAGELGEPFGCPPGGDGGKLQALPRGLCKATGLTDPFIAVRTDPATGQMVTNYGNQSLADVFSCIGLLGDTGCGYEHQLSSVRHALDPSLAPAVNAGFLRRDAFLAVVLITDEDDCSAPSDSKIFEPDTDPGAVASFRCNRFGHVCEVGGKLVPPSEALAGQSLQCHSAEDGKLDKVSDFVAFLKTLKRDPARVFLAAVTGPATPYTVALRLPDGTGSSSNVTNVQHSCTASDGTSADPSVRIAEAVSAFGSHGLFSSICGDSMGPVLHEISERFTRPLAPACVPTPSPTGPGCTVVDRWLDAEGAPQAARIPSCDAAPNAAPCWRLVPDEALCGSGARRLQVDRGNSAAAAGIVSAIDCTAPHP